jgi:PAS domain S-box-containing protein
MTLQNKTLFIVSSILIGTIFIIFIISENTLMNSFQELENNYARDNTRRVYEVLQNEVDHLALFADDWAAWDDTYAFIEDSNERYIRTNLPNTTFVSNRLNFIAYFNIDGELVYGRRYDPIKAEQEELPEIWRQQYFPEHPLFIARNEAGKAIGILKTPQGNALLVVSFPILDSFGKGPPRGTLVMGRLFDAREIQRLSKAALISLQLHDLDKIQANSEIAGLLQSLSINAPLQTRIHDAQIINGYLLLKDIYNQPAYILETALPRDITQHGQSSLNYFLKQLLFVGLVAIVAILALLNRLVLIRLIRYSKNLASVRSTNDLATRLNLDGNDELTRLGHIINDMLAALQNSHEEMKEVIKERTETLEALQISEEKFAKAFRNSPDLISITSVIDGRILEVSENAEKFTGYRLDELIGQSVIDLGIWSDLEDRAMMIKTMQDTGNASGFETALRKCSGEIIDVEISAEIVDIGSESRMVSVVRDITDRKQAEQELRESEKRLLTAQRIAHLGFWEWNIVTREMYWSDESYHIYGLRRGEFEVSYEGFLDSVHPEDRARVDKRRVTAMYKGMDYNIDFRIKRAGSQLRHVHEEGMVNYDKNGKPVSMVGTMIDITRRKQSEAVIERYQMELRALVSKLSLAEEQERRRIAAELHDGTIQNLGLFKFKLSALKKSLSTSYLPPVMDELCELIEQTIQDTRLLVFELSPPVLYELGVESAIEWLAEEVQKQRGLVCQVHNDHQPKPLDDTVRVILFQAVRELLLNANKHARASMVKIFLRRVHGHIRIDVVDDGIGFDTSTADFLTSGTSGFGLFSIRERLSLIDGQLDIESRPGHGTKITLSTPLKLTTKENIA